MNIFACPPYYFEQVLIEHDANKNICKGVSSHSVLQRDPTKMFSAKEQPASVWMREEMRSHNLEQSFLLSQTAQQQVWCPVKTNNWNQGRN